MSTPELRPPETSRAVPLARNRNFALLWGAQACAEVGFSASLIAFPLLVLALTGSATVSGLVLAADAVAQLVVALPGGALVDRWNRKWTMVLAEGTQAVALATLVLALFSGTVSAPHLVIVAAVLGGCRALFEPAEDACLPSLVAEHQVPTAIAMNTARASVGQMAGTALGGMLFAIGRWVPFVLDLVSHLIAAAALLFIRVPARQVAPTPITHLGREIAEGLRWVLGRREIVLTACCVVGLNLFFNAFYLVVIVLAEHRGTPPGEIGVMAAMLGVGGVLGALIAPWLHRTLSPHQAIAGVFWSLTLLAPVAVPLGGGYLTGGLFALMALLAPTANTTILSHQILVTPDRLRGRLSGTMKLAVGTSAALGPALGGLLADLASPANAILISAAGMALLTVFVTVNPTLRRLPGRTEREEATL